MFKAFIMFVSVLVAGSQLIAIECKTIGTTDKSENLVDIESLAKNWFEKNPEFRLEHKQGLKFDTFFIVAPKSDRMERFLDITRIEYNGKLIVRFNSGYAFPSELGSLVLVEILQSYSRKYSSVELVSEYTDIHSFRVMDSLKEYGVFIHRQEKLGHGTFELNPKVLESKSESRTALFKSKTDTQVTWSQAIKEYFKILSATSSFK